MRITWRKYRTITHNSLFATSFLIFPFWILQQFDTKFIHIYSFTLFYNILLNQDLSSAHRFDLQKIVKFAPRFCGIVLVCLIQQIYAQLISPTFSILRLCAHIRNLIRLEIRPFQKSKRRALHNRFVNCTKH